MTEKVERDRPLMRRVAMLDQVEEKVEDLRLDRYEGAVTAKLLRALQSPNPKARYFVTTPTYAMAVARRILPNRALDWITGRA